MNDGQYRLYEPSIGEEYERAMKEIVARVKEAGAVAVVGSPGAVDTYSFKRDKLSPKDYNANLAQLRDIAHTIAAEAGMPFANVHDAMVNAMAKAKPVLGEAYDVCGGDGFHPQPNGHIVMAYAFLKGMGLDGEIGRITVDLKGQSSATEGHSVISSSGGKVELESRRYPFCFEGDETKPASTRSIVPFVPFNEDLNRLTLIVKNLGADRATVAWGALKKSFSREALEKGINLAAEFPENPFSEPFRKVDERVARKQAFETPMIKEVITRFRGIQEMLPGDPEVEAALEKLRSRLAAKDEDLHAQARAAVTPVRHTIEVTPG
jgi:hypothetical protein